jgi:hypothetical protein
LKKVLSQFGAYAAYLTHVVKANNFLFCYNFTLRLDVKDSRIFAFFTWHMSHKKNKKSQKNVYARCEKTLL